MPVNRQIAVRRRARYAPYAAAQALARGARMAYENRQMIQDATQAVKRKAQGLFRRRPKKAARTTKTVASVSNPYAGGNDYTRSKRTVGRYKKPTVQRLNRLVQVGMNNQIYRFQNITNFDTNTGAFPLANWQFTNNSTVSPFHVYDLTSLPNNAAQAPGKYYGWTDLTSAANVVRFPLPGQTAAGAADASGHWQIENKGGVNATSTNPNASKMVHNWSDVRLLLYGARKRTTRFDIMFFRVADEFSNLHYANVSNPELKELCQYIERPAIYTPLQSLTGAHITKKIRMIKSFTHYISASQTTDVDTSVGKTKEVRIFLRHGKVYNLDYKHWNEDGTTVLPHAQEDGIDYEQDTKQHNHPWYSSQVFMVIRAFAPERVAGKTAYPSTADANVDPSYDIIIRNSVSTPA